MTSTRGKGTFYRKADVIWLLSKISSDSQIILFLAADFFVKMDLIREQAEALQFVMVGHNLLITEQVGVGKSRLLTSSLQVCESRNLIANNTDEF